MTTISLIATDQQLAISANPVIASGDVDSVQLHIDFDSAWSGYSKNAVFFTEEDDTVYEKVLNLENECIVPHEVLSEFGVLYIGVRGVKNAQVKTSTLVKFQIKEGSPSGNGTHVDPTPDMYQQILTAYGETKSEVIDIRARFEETLKKTYKTYDLLWENPDPTVAFPKTTVDIGVDAASKYSDFLITYKNNMHDSADNYSHFFKKPHEYDGELITGNPGGYASRMLGFASGDDSAVVYERYVSMTVSTGKVYFYDCNSNGFVIPCKIYGVNQQVRTDIDALAASAVEKLFITMTKAEYDALVEAGGVDETKYYTIVG